MNMQIDVIELPKMRAAALRHVGPYQQIGPVFDKLVGIAVVSGWFTLPEACTMLVTYDCPDTVPAAELRADHTGRARYEDAAFRPVDAHSLHIFHGGLPASQSSLSIWNSR